MKRIVIGITGASGSVYGKRIIEELLKKNIEVRVVFTSTGSKVFQYELSVNPYEWSEELKRKYSNIIFEDNDNLFSAIASGSFNIDGMVIIPCSMGTLAEISHGLAKNLLCRTADVCLKEKRPLILVPRETPLNSIHLRNMLTLSEAGATIIPPSPGFYHHPHTYDDLVDFVVGKVLDNLKIENTLFDKWGSD